MAYQYIVLDSVFNFEKDGVYSGFTDVNGLASKQKAIRDDNLAGEILTSLAELLSAIFIPFAAGAVIGKLAAAGGRIASFINKVSTTTTKIVSFANKAISTVKNPIVKYGIQTLGRSTLKGAADITKAAVVGLPIRTAKGDKIGDTLKNYGIALLGAFSTRAVGSFAYDTYLYRKAGYNIFDDLIRDRQSVIKDFGLKKQLQNKILDIERQADKVVDIRKLSRGKRTLREIYKISKTKLTKEELLSYAKRTDLSKATFENFDDFLPLRTYEGDFFSKKFITTQLADDLVKGILKGAEKFSFITIGKNIASIFKKFILSKILFRLQSNKYTNRILLFLKRLTDKRDSIIKKIQLSLQKIKDYFYEKFNLKRVKDLFDKEELKKYKRIKEATNLKNRQGLSEKEKIAKLAEADEFLLKNQKLVPFEKEGQGEGQFGSEWLLGYKWIAKYNNITKELEPKGSLRVFFRAKYPRQKYRTAKDRKGNTKKFERSIFKAAITFKEVPFEMYEDFLDAESQGSYYWNNFAKQPKGKAGWKPRTNTDIDWLLGQQNYSEIYGLQVKGLPTQITKTLLSYNKAGQNILKYQGKTKEILNFIKKPTSIIKTNLNNVIKKVSRI